VRKNREDACLTSMTEFRSTFEKATVGIALIDERGLAMESNATLQELLAYSGEELERTLFQSLMGSQDREIYKNAQRSITAGDCDFYQSHLSFIRKDGDVLRANMTLLAIRNSDRRSRYTLSLVERNSISVQKS
jgi:PAS domain S-box-containing protein